MAHHGQGDGPYTSELKKLMEAAAHPALERALGDTGRYPQGQLTPDDEGELKLAVTAKDGKVVVDFGKPVAWIGFDADQAIELAMTLARRAGKVKGVPITIHIGRAD